VRESLVELAGEAISKSALLIEPFFALPLASFGFTRIGLSAGAHDGREG